jgi:hypothetical protein
MPIPYEPCRTCGSVRRDRFRSPRDGESGAMRRPHTIFLSRESEPPRRRRRVMVILVGVGVVGALGYTGWRALSRDSGAGEVPIESGETDAVDMPPVT